MNAISLNEIQKLAQQESARHHHYYIGVEHLFIALTKLDRGLSNAVLEFCGLEPRFVRYSIRQVIGVNEDRRYWSGFKTTPRAQEVLNRVKRYAGIHNPSERDVLIAILDEGDSIPLRVLAEMGADTETLRRTAANWSGRQRGSAPAAPIQSEVTLSEDEKTVLQRMFRTYERIEVERELAGSYTAARLLVVRPHQTHRAEARVVVKIDLRNNILHEKRHYDAYVKDTLPPTTARLLDNPALPEDCLLGGLKYTLIQPSGSTNPVDLKTQAQEMSGIELANIIQNNIYEVYAPAWWSQRQRYRFGVWREYEHTLPAAIEIIYVPDAQAQSASQILEPLGVWSRRSSLSKGELVELRGFTVQKIRYEKGGLQLTSGYGPEAVNRSSKVEVHGMSEQLKTFRAGDVVPSIVGRVTTNRETILRQQLEMLDPPFDPRESHIAAPEVIGDLPNPLHHINHILDRRLSGYLSIIHGDLHLGNILVGPAGDAWLIDFDLTREGHVLFDWALLEVSILSSVISPHMSVGWSGVWEVVRLLHMINMDESIVHLRTPVADALESIKAIREIVQQNLARAHLWSEYYLALVLVSLRGLSWQSTTSTDVRRLLFLNAALAVQAADRAESSIIGGSDATREGMMTSEVNQLSDFDLVSDEDD